MNPRRALPVFAAALAVAVTAACGAPAVTPAAPPPATTPPVFTPVVGEVRVAPVPVLGEDDRTHLVYELSLTNYFRAPATVGSVEVLDKATGRSLLRVAGAELAARMRPMSGSDQYVNVLAPGQLGNAFLHVALPDGVAAPAALEHRISVAIGELEAETTLAPTTVDARRLPVLAPPLRGEGYLAADGCCDPVRHVRAVLPVDGAPTLAQRFAIDYEQVDDEGRIYVGERTDPRSYHVYGDELLAVADATVVAAHDGQAEEVPGDYPENLPLSEADGNYVVLDIGEGFFVTYAHLQPGTLRVRAGQRVRSGDTLGLVGNSGNTIVPHLHIHVTDGPSPIASEGVPYLIDEFTVTGRIVSTEAFDLAESTGEPAALVPGLQPTTHRERLVLDQGIVTFG